MKKLFTQCTYKIEYGIQKIWVTFTSILQILISEDFEVPRTTMRCQGHKTFISIAAFVKRNLLTNLLQLLLLECT